MLAYMGEEGEEESISEPIGDLGKIFRIHHSSMLSRRCDVEEKEEMTNIISMPKQTKY
jgi:hypothetical protein